MTLQDLIDKQEITEVVYRYATALDSRRPELLDDVFTDDAVFLIGAGVGRFEGRQAIGDVVSQYLGGLEASQHILSNPVIEVDGDHGISLRRALSGASQVACEQVGGLHDEHVEVHDVALGEEPLVLLEQDGVVTRFQSALQQGLRQRLVRQLSGFDQPIKRGTG